MKQEYKDLILKDLCARLPYGVKCYGFQMKIDGNDNECYGVLKSISDCPYGWKFELKDRVALNNKKCYEENYLEVKPYLFPLSSMTDEKKEIYCQLQQKVIYNSKGVVTEDVMNYVNWCYENHLDVNDLIPKDLALDATGLNIY